MRRKKKKGKKTKKYLLEYANQIMRYYEEKRSKRIKKGALPEHSDMDMDIIIQTK